MEKTSASTAKHERWDFASLLFGCAGATIAALGMLSIFQRSGHAVEIVSPAGILHFLSSYYVLLREGMTYWWLPAISRWFGFQIMPWMEDVSAVLGGIAFGLSIAKDLLLADEGDEYSPIIRQLLLVPSMLRPAYLVFSFLASIAAYFALTLLAIGIFSLIGGVLVSIGLGVSIWHGMGAALPLAGIAGWLFGPELLGALVPRLAGYDTLALNYGMLAVGALAFSIAAMVILVGLDMLGVILQLWPSPT